MNREKIKPFVGGAIAGAALLAIAAFSAGWVVTDASKTRQVQAAWIDGQASICASLAQAHRTETGDVSDLSGYQARDTRNDLANAYAVVLHGEEKADPGVVRACADLLDKTGA